MESDKSVSDDKVVRARDEVVRRMLKTPPKKHPKPKPGRKPGRPVGSNHNA